MTNGSSCPGSSKLLLEISFVDLMARSTEITRMVTYAEKAKVNKPTTTGLCHVSNLSRTFTGCEYPRYCRVMLGLHAQPILRAIPAPTTQVMNRELKYHDRPLNYCSC